MCEVLEVSSQAGITPGWNRPVSYAGPSGSEKFGRARSVESAMKQSDKT